MKQTTVKQTPNGTYNPLVPSTVGSYSNEDHFIQGIVVACVTNDKHPQYAPDGYNIGAIQWRSIETDMFKDDSVLHWALPLDANISDYPLLGELVTIFSAANRLFYTAKLNISSRPTVQVIYGLNEELQQPAGGPSNKVPGYMASTANAQVQSSQPSANTLGDYFVDNQGVFRLAHDEGDIIFEGRSGQSIRFGAAWKSGNTNFTATTTDQSPNILMRVGQDPNAAHTAQGIFGVVREDINTDASSIYMVSDQIIKLTLAVPKGKSITNYPTKLDGNQIVINTDRFIVNSKKDKIMGFAKNGIHWTSAQDFTADVQGNNLATAQGDYKVTVQGDVKVAAQGHVDIKATGTTSILGQQVFVGTENSTSEPIPCGASLASFLDQLISIFVNSTPTTLNTDGSSGVLMPSIIAQLAQLQAQLEPNAQAIFNSTLAYTTKS